MKKNQKGITLIALVVTIIVLLILAGISINALAGQNGILSRAIKAKNDSDAASDLEYLQVEATSELMDYYQGNDTKSEDDYILDKWDSGKNSKIKVNKIDKTVTYNGKVYAMSDIIGSESEKSKINDSNMTQITISTATKEEDKEMLSSGKVRLIVEEENNMRAYIPNGFYYVSGKPSNGMVISDIYGDDDKNTKGGNQFVWVPCSTDTSATAATDNGTTVTYEKVNGLATTWRANYTGTSKNSYQWYYTKVPEDKKDDKYVYENAGKAITDWKDEDGNTPSVKKYGGFYIARYEAGLPENSALWSKKNGATYGWTNGQAAGSTGGNRNNDEKNIPVSQIDGMIPVSKKNNASWNRISQKNAVAVSKKMYAGSKTVTSNLVDSYAWDTILAWYEKVAKANGTTINCTASTGYGNYYDTTFGIPTNSQGQRPNKLSLKNVLYAVHVYNTSTGWAKIDSKYHYLTTEIDTDEIDPKKQEVDKNRTVYEIATGASDYTKVNNIYDMAGNMWEWTTEVGDHSVTNSDPTKTTGNYAVLRGGSFYDNGGSGPVSNRDGDNDASWSSFNIGFRVVLYINE